METSKATKIISAKALKTADYTYPEIADILGISEKTAYNYVRKATSKEWEETYQIITRLLTLREDIVSSKTLNLIESKLDRAEFSELIALYKVVKRENENKPESQVNIANFLRSEGERFGIGGEKKVDFVEYDPEEKTSSDTIEG